MIPIQISIINSHISMECMDTNVHLHDVSGAIFADLIPIDVLVHTDDDTNGNGFRVCHNTQVHTALLQTLGIDKGVCFLKVCDEYVVIVDDTCRVEKKNTSTIL
jgi:hypothetical protein